MPRARDQLASPTLAQLYYQQGNLEKAIEILKEVLKNNPGNLKVRETLEQWEAEWFRSATPEQRRARAQKLNQILEQVRKERRKE